MEGLGTRRFQDELPTDCSILGSRLLVSRKRASTRTIFTNQKAGSSELKQLVQLFLARLLRLIL